MSQLIGQTLPMSQLKGQTLQVLQIPLGETINFKMSIKIKTIPLMTAVAEVEAIEAVAAANALAFSCCK